MKKTLAVTATLLAVAIAMGLYLYVYLPQKEKESAPPMEWMPGKVIERTETFNRFTLKTPEFRIALERIPNSEAWRIVEPLEALADSITSQMLINDFSNLEMEKLIDPDPKDLSQYHLDQPLAEVVYEFSNRDPVTLLIGKINYGQDHFFAKLESAPEVFLVPIIIKEHLRSSVEQFRSKTLLFHHPSQIQGFEMKIDDPEIKKSLSQAIEPKLVVQKQKEGKPEWVILKPINEPAAFDEVSNFFTYLQRPYALSVIDIEEKDLPQYGLDSPRARILFSMLDGTREEIWFGDSLDTESKVYALNTAQPRVLVVDGKFFENLILSDFRKRNIINIDSDQKVNKLVVQFPRRDEEDYTLITESRRLLHVDKDPEKAVPRMRVTAIYNLFRTSKPFILHHLEPFHLEDYGLAPERLRVRAYGIGDALIFDVSLGDTLLDEKSGTVYTYILDRNRNFVAALPVNAYEKMPYKLQDMILSEEEKRRIMATPERGERR